MCLLSLFFWFARSQSKWFCVKIRRKKENTWIQVRWIVDVMRWKYGGCGAWEEARKRVSHWLYQSFMMLRVFAAVETRDSRVLYTLKLNLCKNKTQSMLACTFRPDCSWARMSPPPVLGARTWLAASLRDGNTSFRHHPPPRSRGSVCSLHLASR